MITIDLVTRINISLQQMTVSKAKLKI
jgi:hypothetical protein